MAGKRIPIREQLLSRFVVDPLSGCWLWTGSISSDGYAVVCIRSVNVAAHRLSWELHVGAIPQGTRFTRTCHNRACINPAHLAVVRLPLEERFMAYVEPLPECGCWLWIGHTNGKAGAREYGKFRVDTVRHAPALLAHRVAYELFRGPIPSGMHLDHLCRVPLCVNPFHLDPVTNLINTRRGNSGKHQASRTHCPQGHPYDAENTLLIEQRRGKYHSINRMCRECSRQRRRAWYHKGKQLKD